MRVKWQNEVTTTPSSAPLAACTQTCGTPRIAVSSPVARARPARPLSACPPKKRRGRNCRRRSSTVWRAVGTAPVKEKLLLLRVVVCHRWPVLGPWSLRCCWRGLHPPLPTPARPPQVWIFLLSLQWIKATARQVKKEEQNREQVCFALAGVQRTSMCQLPQLKPSTGDLVYHIHVCKTSASQHVCTPPPHTLSFFTSACFYCILSFWLINALMLMTQNSLLNPLLKCIDPSIHIEDVAAYVCSVLCKPSSDPSFHKIDQFENATS